MEILLPELELPIIEFQHIKRDGARYFRIVSLPLEKSFLSKLQQGQIRVQLWLERQVTKQSGKGIKTSWVHSKDNSDTRPERLFNDEEYNYGGGKGWGFMTLRHYPPYSTNNGYVPTEHEITMEDIVEGRIIKTFSVLDIFTNIIKSCPSGIPAISDGDVRYMAILGRGHATIQPLRMRLAVNNSGKPMLGLPSNTLILGIHRNCELPTFNPDVINGYIKISYAK